jgi:two-component system nitrate/nitrite response regulator NarL
MKTVAVCETQPITAEGIRAVVERCPELEFSDAVGSLSDAVTLLRECPPDILVLDKGFGAQAVFAWISDIRDAHLAREFVVWGTTMSEAEALRLLQSGVRGIIRKTASPASLVSCLRAVAEGTSWMEESLFRDHPQRDRYPRSELTPREQQVLDLVEQGLKNKEIARELGIRPGTVKIHLKHIFEKTGVRGRYGLALSGLKDKGLLELPHV